jgi:BolA protein
MHMAERIEQRLRDALAPDHVTVRDDSHQHEGHAGWQPGGETHIHVDVVAHRFAGQTRVSRHRMVYDALDAELRERVHALQITALTPDEAAARTG